MPSGNTPSGQGATAPVRKPIEGSDRSGEKETPSLFKRPKKAKEETDAQILKEERVTEFTQADLEKVWSEFRDLEVERSSTENEVLKRKVTKAEGYVIEIQLVSSLEITIFERMEIEVVAFLRSKLENDKISVAKRVEEVEASKKLYTSKDIYEYMAEVNPAIVTLKEKLGLDFEF